MPIITLKFRDTKIQDFTLAEGMNLTIGRRDTNDVVIENLAVSGMHAKIDSIDISSIIGMASSPSARRIGPFV